jgi:phospholipid/cholesterol/gamma-HCH transport system substrate-binding protein
MENKSHATAAGLFVVLALGLVVALAAWLSRDMGARRVYEISTASIVTGLQPQAAVRFRGVSVGKVDSIGFDAASPGNVLIRLSVDTAAPITSTTFATLDLQGVTGLTYVQLDDRAPAGGPLETSSAQPARIPLRAGLLATLSERGAEAITQLEVTSKRLTELLSENNQKALIGSVQSIGQAAQDLGTLSKGLDSTVREQLRPALASVPPLTKSVGVTLEALRASSGDIGQAANATQQTATEFGNSAKTLNRTLERLQASGGALDKLQEGSAALAQSGQQLNQNTLPRVGRLAEEGARAAQALQRTAGDLSDNPQSLVWGNGTPPPGPGEAGFQAPAARSAP